MSVPVMYLEVVEGTPASEDIFRGQIRKAPDGRVAAVDIVKCIVYRKDDGSYIRDATGNVTATLKRLGERGLIPPNTVNNTHTFSGRNQKPTRIMTEEEVYELIMLLPGTRASAFRRNTAKLLRHYFHASEELISDLLRRYEASHGREFPRPETKSKDVSGEPRIKQCESVKSAANEIAATPRAKVDDKVYAKVFGMQNKSIMNMTADEFRAVQGLKKSDLIRDMWTEEMNSGAFFMNCVFKAAVSGGEDPVVAMERLSKTMTPTFKSVGLHDQAKAKRPREFLVRNKDMREGHLASKKLIGGSPAKRACLSIQS
eukprot:jgi/Mesvir1/13612/Mv05140-RA.1